MIGEQLTRSGVPHRWSDPERSDAEVAQVRELFRHAFQGAALPMQSLLVPTCHRIFVRIIEAIRHQKVHSLISPILRRAKRTPLSEA